MRQVRSVLIGTGNIAAAHVRATQEVRNGVVPAPAGVDVQMVAATDVDGARARAFCQRHGIARAYDGVAEMLEQERPDLVHICTPPGPHAALAVQSLEAGAWVLCEKPLCSGLAELDRIEAAEQRTGNYCSSVFQQRFGSGAQHVRALIEQGALGRALVGLCQTTWYRDAAYYAVPWHARWEEAFGGPTATLGIHTMDLFLWLLGDWREVSAMAATLDRDVEVEDVSVATVRLASGALATIVNSALSPRQETYLRLDFQRATVEARYLYRNTSADWRFSLPDHPTFRASPEQLAELERWRAVPGGDAEVAASQGAELGAILRAKLAGERPPASGPDVRRTIELISCLYKSAAVGRPVAQGSLAPDDPYYQRAWGTLPERRSPTGSASGAPAAQPASA